MKRFWQSRPWLPLALLMAFFVLAWLAWLLTALRHAPETVPTGRSPEHPHAAAR